MRNGSQFDTSDGRKLKLFTIHDFMKLKAGTVFYSISGTEMTVGVDYIDPTVIDGHICYGVIDETA